MDSTPPWVLQAPDRRIISCRFFLHCADFLEYIGLGVQEMYRGELATPFSWNEAQHYSVRWNSDLATYTILMKRLAYFCIQAKPHWSSVRDYDGILGPDWTRDALIGDGSNQIGVLINTPMIMDVYQSRVLVWKKPIAACFLLDSVLEKLQRDLPTLEGWLCRRDVLCRKKCSASTFPGAPLLDSVLERVDEQMAWSKLHKRLNLNRSWQILFKSIPRADSVLSLEPPASSSDSSDSDDECLDRLTTLLETSSAEGTST